MTYWLILTKTAIGRGGGEVGGGGHRGNAVTLFFGNRSGVRASMYPRMLEVSRLPLISCSRTFYVCIYCKYSNPGHLSVSESNSFQ